MHDLRSWALRFGWLTVVGGLLFHRDMCLGGNKREPNPEDSGPVDSSSDTGKDAHVRPHRPVEVGGVAVSRPAREKV